MTSQHVEFMEGAGIAQVFNALARKELAFGLMALDGARTSGIDCLFLTGPKVVNLVLHG
jgi:hypothetical protein